MFNGIIPNIFDNIHDQHKHKDKFDLYMFKLLDNMSTNEQKEAQDDT